MKDKYTLNSWTFLKMKTGNEKSFILDFS